MWNFTRSVEAMFSRWAVKRVFKFLLKKKLGHLILGDIDLEQLDVQLGTGTVQLSDLALNVDYINRKYGTAAGLIVKEGSIGALVLKMPWKGQGCQVEVDELEVVLCPCVGNSSPSGAESCSGRDTNSFNSGDLGKLERETVDDAGTSASMHVHEGVKTIAKMLKGLLTSFHVKVKRVLVAFDPCLERDERDTSCQMILVLRVTETECGTCLSEDFNSDNDEENFLGISGLTNFARFHGTAVELLQMDEVDKNKWPFSERFSGPRPSTAAIPILAGEHGGISGTVKLCIPWKNGSLDVHQVDSEVFLDPVELKLQPSVVKWLMLAWKSLQDIHHHATDSVYYNSASHLQSSDLSSFAIGTDKVFLDTGPCFADVSFPRAPETVTSSLLPGSNFISDWVPLSAEKYEDKTEEADFGTSLDHFFECFDEMRSSQSSLGGSGIWNWTNSVFSAITAASSLASGSFHIPSEQQHVQTNLKATISGISVVLCFDDENMKHLCVSSAGQRKFSSNAHFLGGKCLDVVFAMQVCPQKIRFESTIRHIEVADYFSDRMEFGSVDFNNVVNSKSLLIQHLQAEVLGAVTPFVSSTNDSDSPQSNGLGARDLSSIQSSLDLAIGGPDCESSEMEGLVKVMLLASSGASCSQCTVSSCYSDGNSIRSVSFSLELPQFVLWVDFDLVNMLFVLWRKVETSYEVKNSRDGSMSEATGMMHGSPFLETMKRATCPCAASSSPEESLQGNIVVPNARVILCFPFEDNNHVRRHLAWDQFIALNISSPLALGKKKVPGVNNLSHANVQKQYSLRASHSVNLNAGNFDLYLVLSSEKGNLGDCCGLERKRFSARHVLCVTSESGSGSLINMIWQDASVTGPWLVKRVKDLAASGNLGSRSKVIGKGNEFASVTTKQDVEDSKFRLHREMISSSSFFLHADLPPVRVTLDSLLYKHLLCLIGQAIDGLSCVSRDPLTAPEDCSNSQTSLLLECNSVEILLSPGTETFLKGSIHDELLGSWQHLKLKIQKFELLSVSNIGGVRGASLLWGGHGEGQLWGVVSGSQNQELLLISCSNSSMRRGDGGGSNAMSYGLAGSDIIHLWDPQSFARSTSISVRCGTIVAIRGRLDWLECISCLFRVASPENHCAVDEHLPNRDSKDSAPWETSFVLNLVDVGLSYEPFSKIPSASDEVSDINSRSGALNDGFSHIACLLAAASFSISNAVVASSMGDDYRITVRDLGLLLSIATRSENIVGLYSVENLHKNGYVRVAREAFTEATLRTNCTNGLQWELECSEFHTPVVFDTCHDTTSGLIRLVAELQQLFSPNIEESAVHLQARWNNVQQATEKNSLNDEARICNSGSASSASSDRGTEPNASGLMDEICDDAFNIDGNQLHALDSCESRYYILPDGTGLGDACSTRAPEGSSMSGQTSSLTNGCIPDIIECFYRPEMTPSELPLVNQPLKEYGCRPKRVDNGGMEKENVGWYKDASIRIVEDHISQTSLDDCPKQFRDSNLSCSNCLKIADPTDIQMPRGQIRLKNISVRWMMHAGSDWVDLGKLESTNVHGRDRSVCLELALLGIDFQYSIFAEGQICASKISLAVKDLYLYDNSKDAPWKLVLGYYGSKERPRDSSANAFKLDLEAVRPNPSIPLDEYRLRMGFLPLLLHLHQVHLDFLVDFFGEKSLQVEQSPVPALHLDCQQTITEEALLPYFQKFDIWPLLVRVDYTPCRVDLTALRGGKYVELINLVPWKGVELQLKHVHAVGVYGWSTVCETIIGDWLEDISQNQIHKLLHGLPTIRSLVAVGSGAAKLVSLPVKSYKKDHKLLKGMQRGTVAFLKSISLEAVGLGLHLAAGAHDILLQAEYILTSIPPVSSPVASRTKTNTRGNQPKDAQQGFQQACESLSNGLGRSASALVQAPIKSYQRGAGAGSALASAVRAAPAAALAPASAAAGAVRFALLGVRNSLDPEHKRESMDKYRGPTQPRERS